MGMCADIAAILNQHGHFLHDPAFSHLLHHHRAAARSIPMKRHHPCPGGRAVALPRLEWAIPRIAAQPPQFRSRPAVA